MQILLATLNAKYIHMNLAVRLLYEYNKKNHEGLSWKEFTIKEDKQGIADYCANYEVVAFSCYIWNITQTLLVAKLIKEINPNTKILLGGPEVSYEWQLVIEDDAIDFIITGEGEIPFQAFLEQYPTVDLVPNLVRKIGDEVRYNPQSITFDLKNYEHLNPYSNDTSDELYNKVSYIETSRGCPYKCEFCLASLDNKVRYLPNDNIKANLLYLMQNGRVIKFLDRTFNIKRDFTIDIFQFILDNHRPCNVFQFEITADILHPDIVQFIDDYVPKGLMRFEIGIQTVNQKANLEVSRKQSFEKTKGVIQSLSHKIDMHLDLIVGLPLDEWEDSKYSFEEVFKLFAPELQLGFLKFLKGTPMRDKYQEHDYVFDPMPPYQIIESKYLSKTQLAQIVQLENALETYWNKRRADLTLRYVTLNYSIFDFLLGLGAYFESKTSFHKHTATDIYEHLFHYASQTFPDDSILHQLVAIDYYLFHKIKPKVQYVNEISRVEKNELIKILHLNHHQNRYAIIPISFNYDLFKQEHRIELQDDNLIIQYAANKTPTIINKAQIQVS